MLFFLRTSFWIILVQLFETFANLVFPEVKTIVGQSAKLLCQTITTKDDSIQLILWYQSANGTGPPFYTIDSRKSESLNNAIHSISPKFKNRIFLNTSTEPSFLIINPTKEEDSSYYSCRVDYKWSRTTISTSKLFVVVAPQNTIIEEIETGKRLFKVGGPYLEGSTLKLKCVSNKGRPLPSLIWYLDNQMIDNYFTTFQHLDKVENELIVHHLTRDFFNSNLSCEAKNYEALPPVSVSISLDMYLKPLEVNITTPKKPLRVGQSQEIICHSKGSRPSPKISWYIDNIKLNDSIPTLFSNETITTSIINYVPSNIQNFVTFTCEAQNELIPNSSIQFLWNSELFFSPKLKLTYDENERIIVKGSVIKLNCYVQANPKVSEIYWLLNDHIIESTQGSANASIIVNVTKSHKKDVYQCVAMNSEGKSKSNKLKLNIYYQPICTKKKEKIIFQLSLGDTLNLSCQVDAQLSNSSFWWKFNNNLTNFESNNFIYSNKQAISYQINSEKSYGTFICGANNLTKNFQNNCQFQIIPKNEVNFNLTLFLTIKGIIVILILMILVNMKYTRKCFYFNKKAKTKIKSEISYIGKKDDDKIKSNFAVNNPDVIPVRVTDLDFREMSYSDLSNEKTFNLQKLQRSDLFKFEHFNNVSFMQFVGLNCANEKILNQRNSEMIPVINSYNANFEPESLTFKSFEKSNSYSLSTTV